MLVSHRYKFIYTKTAKTGGTSVESYFEKYCMAEGEWVQLHERDEYVSKYGIIGYRGAEPPIETKYVNHMSALKIKDLLGDDCWSRYLKFCVVRNPFDKAVSEFFFRIQKSGKIDENQDLDRWKIMFEKWLSESPKLPLDTDKFLIDKKNCMDYVIRYESLHKDMSKVCDLIGVSWDSRMLPSFKSGIRPENIRFQDLYTDVSKRIIEKVFQVEIERFGYSL